MAEEARLFRLFASNDLGDLFASSCGEYLKAALATEAAVAATARHEERLNFILRWCYTQRVRDNSTDGCAPYQTVESSLSYTTVDHFLTPLESFFDAFQKKQGIIIARIPPSVRPG